MSKITDLIQQFPEEQEKIIRRANEELNNLKERIQVLENMQNQIMQITLDTQVRVREIQDMMHDVSTRMHDVQDRTYDIISHNDILSELQGYEKDMKVRVADSQDRIYDLIWQTKTQVHQRNLMFWNIYKHGQETIEDAQKRFFKELPIAEGENRLIQTVLAKLLHAIHDICEENHLSYWLDFGSLIGAVRHDGYIPWDDDIDLGMMRTDMEKLEKILKNDKRFHVRHVFLNRQDGNGVLRLFQVRWADTDRGTLKLYIDIFVYDYCENGSDSDWKWFMEEKSRFVEHSKSLPKDVSEEGNNKKQIILKNEFEKEKEIVNKHLNIKYDDADYIIFGFENINYLNYEDNHLLKKSQIFPLKKLSFEGKECYVPNEYFKYVSAMYEDIYSLPSDMLTHNHFNLNEEKIEILKSLYETYCK